jgi:hypothetical protein
MATIIELMVTSNIFGQNEKGRIPISRPGRHDDNVVAASFVRRVYTLRITPQNRSPPEYPLHGGTPSARPFVVPRR